MEILFIQIVNYGTISLEVQSYLGDFTLPFRTVILAGLVVVALRIKAKVKK